jgi:hypothetical protein
VGRGLPQLRRRRGSGDGAAPTTAVVRPRRQGLGPPDPPPRGADLVLPCPDLRGTAVDVPVARRRLGGSPDSGRGAARRAMGTTEVWGEAGWCHY